MIIYYAGAAGVGKASFKRVFTKPTPPLSSYAMIMEGREAWLFRRIRKEKAKGRK